MKKLFIVAAIFSCFCFFFNIYSQQWVATYNGTSNGDDKGYAITVDSIGNTYIAGYTTNNNTGIDMCVIKLNTSGSKVWSRSYDGPAHSDDKAYAIVVDKLLNVYITGYSTSINGSKDFTTIKYNSSGTQQWVQPYNTPLNKDDEASSIVLDDSSNVYVTGYITLGNTEIYTIKYNQNGVFQWGYTYGGPGNQDDKAYGIVIDALRNLYIIGYSNCEQTGNDFILLKFNYNGQLKWTSNYNGNANGDDRGYGIAVDRFQNIIITGQSTNENSGYDYATLKYNCDGEILWTRIYNGIENHNDRPHGIVVDSIGNIFITGSSNSDSTEGSEDFLTVKYNSDGNEMWTAGYNDSTGNYSDIPNGLYLNPKKSSIYVAGLSRNISVPGSQDIIVIKYNLSSGALLQKIKYNGTANSDDAAYGIVVDKFSNVFITGYISNVFSGNDIITAKYQNGELIGIEPISSNVPKSYKLYQNYPNPFNPATNIKFDVLKSSNVTIKVYDIVGREVSNLLDEYLNIGTYELKCDFNNLSSGVYFYEMRAGDFKETLKMVFNK
jgi:uncharacterized delta-60 repeat protein